MRLSQPKLLGKILLEISRQTNDEPIDSDTFATIVAAANAIDAKGK
jgi:hypothetical protein